jgi:hypothetical protein
MKIKSYIKPEIKLIDIGKLCGGDDISIPATSGVHHGNSKQGFVDTSDDDEPTGTGITLPHYDVWKK